MWTLCSADVMVHYPRMEHISDQEVAVIEKKANAIRVSLIESLIEAGSGHTAGPLGMADVFATLFFSVMRYDPKNLLLILVIDSFSLTDTSVPSSTQPWHMPGISL